MNVPTIVVFGSSACDPGSAAYALALELGGAIAAEGWVLCNGCYGGSMEAAARGAWDAGGHTIGVTCTSFGRPGPNSYIREEVKTRDLLARLDALSRRGDAYVVLPGGTGTLLELALVWELANKRLVWPPRPIALLGDGWRPVVDAVRREQPDAPALMLAPDVPALMSLLRAHFAAGAGLARSEPRP